LNVEATTGLALGAISSVL